MRARGWSAALLLGVTAGACTSDLELTLDGRACMPEPPRCVGGYVCDPSNNLCVLPAQLSTGIGGVGGADGTSGASGASATSGSSGDADSGTSAAGAGGSVAAGTGGTSGASGAGGALVDAGPIDADAGCGVAVFRDVDEDGIGDFVTRRIGCPGLGWVTTAGDCRDDLRSVFPGQTQFFSEPYEDVAGPSFDYDCSNDEEPDPSNLSVTAPPNCATLSAALSCAANGFLPASPLRSGMGVEPRCGSNLLRQCEDQGVLACGQNDLLLDPSLAFRCR
jgi:hypothetical protein